MTRPLTHIVDAKTGEEIVREMTDKEYDYWKLNATEPPPAPTKEQLMAELAALTAKINAME